MLKSRTIKQRLIEGLEQLGWSQDLATKTRKYHVMRPAITDAQHSVLARYYIGKAGALRYSGNGVVANAHPHDLTKAVLLRSVVS